ncbi:hypothetical protein BIW11_11020 [Tropilaelaps mercedesae]|uniref:Uncharacterized protein n=1 Tax=Tropilaelaps mercedesae TaxID=418985 RepID=A0A1V9XCZ3_9ACAR|nr:hypothetical protein BIW11_11020 [Tropilaelaps mercedesae]
MQPLAPPILITLLVTAFFVHVSTARWLELSDTLLTGGGGSRIVQCVTTKTTFALRKVDRALHSFEGYLEKHRDGRNSDLARLVEQLRNAITFSAVEASCDFTRRLLVNRTHESMRLISVSLVAIAYVLCVGFAACYESGIMGKQSIVREHVAQCISNTTGYTMRKLDKALARLQSYLAANPEYRKSDLFAFVKELRGATRKGLGVFSGTLAGFLISVGIDAVYDASMEVLSGTLGAVQQAKQMKNISTILVDALTGDLSKKFVSSPDVDLEKRVTETVHAIKFYFQYAFYGSKVCVGMVED